MLVVLVIGSAQHDGQAAHLDRLLLGRGYRYWTGSLCVDLQERDAVEECLHNAPLLFKDFKPSLFKPKTKAGQIQFD